MLFTYARVSTIEQAADGAVSIAEQQRKCRALATMRGVPNDDIVDFVDAGVSGSVSLSDRPAGGELISAARSGDVVVACKLDRLFRSASDALATADTLKARGVDLILIDIGVDPVTSNGVGKLFFGILSLMAEFERDRINERTAEGRKGKRARNGFMGGVAPFGYRVEGEGRDAMLVPDDNEQEIVRIVRAMTPQGPYSIAKHLTERGLLTRTGRPWQRVQIERIIHAAH